MALPAKAGDQERQFVAELVKELADVALMPERLHQAVFSAAKELRERQRDVPASTQGRRRIT